MSAGPTGVTVGVLAEQLPLAHPGHWLAEAAYVLPVIVIVVWISVKALLDRRAEARAPEAPGPEPEPPA